MNKIPDARLGGSYAALKASKWFNNLNWDKLYNQEIIPTWKPKPFKQAEIDRRIAMKKNMLDIIHSEDKGKE